ncbi:MAG: hypothetical protein FJ255_06845 [Phycisphaerae bacterium]|nr:hypothetical protein [Phycisphaerae bacterium]
MRTAALLTLAGLPALAGAQVWEFRGPAPAYFGQLEGMQPQKSPVAGAIRVVRPHPTDPQVIYLGAVNGGVWVTRDALADEPEWTPLTDYHQSLSVGDLEFDTTDPTNQTLVAGVGRFSALGLNGGPRSGLLVTENAGQTWEPAGLNDLLDRNIYAVIKRGSLLMATVNQASQGAVGLYRSTDSGIAFSVVSGAPTSGLPAGAAYDLIAHPTDPQRFYVGIGGSNAGVYASLDAGATWHNLTRNVTGFSGSTNNVLLSYSPHGFDALWVLFANASVANGVWRIQQPSSLGSLWTALDLPGTDEDGTFIGINPGRQGHIHLSLLADRANSNVVYVGGDRQPTSNGDRGGFPNSIGAMNFTGRLFRGDASRPTGQQWRPTTHNGTSRNSAPHADSRSAFFDAQGNIIQGDDGGIYKRLSPASTSGDWISINGTLGAFEFHSIAWDRLSAIALAGSQDNATAEQIETDSTLWRVIGSGDGGRPAVDDLNPQFSERYTSAQYLLSFMRRRVNALNQVTSVDFPQLRLGPGVTAYDADAAQFYTPVYHNTQQSGHLVFLFSSKVFESTTRGDTVAEVTLAPVFPNPNPEPLEGTPTAAAYGARAGSLARPEVLYVGTSAGNLYYRAAAGGFFALLPEYPGAGSGVRDIIVKPDDWRTVVVCSFTRAYITRDAGTTWFDITANLTDTALRSLAWIPPRPSSSDAHRLVIGGLGGAWAKDPTSGSVASDPWQPFGLFLPKAPVRDLEYDDTRRLLVAGLLGRGCWTVHVDACPADLNADGVVDFNDFLIYINLFTLRDPRADLNGDGVVDFNDFLFFINIFGQPC